MAIEPVGALGGIFYGVKQCLVVSSPGRRGDFLDAFGQQLAGAQVFQLERVLAEAGVVRGIGQQVAVVAGGIGAQGDELLSFGQLVQIERNLLRSILVALLLAVDGVLVSLFRAGVV